MKKYFYLNEDEATKGVVLVHEIKHEPIFDYRKHFKESFGLNVVQFIGESLPHYITYEKKFDKVREASIQERFERGEYVLSENQYILNGKIEEIPIPSKVLIKPVWDGKIWSESVTLEEFKELKRKEMKEMREHFNNLPVDYQKQDDFKKYFVDADDYSKNKIYNTCSIFKKDLKKKINWIDANNVVVNFEIEDLENIVNIIAEREQELYTHYASRLKIIANCKTLDEIKKIIW